MIRNIDKNASGTHRRQGSFLAVWTALMCLFATFGSFGLARAQVPSLGLEATEALVEIESIATLAAFAEVEQLLSGLPGVQGVQVTEVNGRSVTFSVLIPGGLGAIDRALADYGSGRLTRSGIAGGRLVYQYRP